MARDQIKGMGVESSSFDKGDIEEVLQRYDQKKTYYIRSGFSNGVHADCNLIHSMLKCEMLQLTNIDHSV